jgi:hypothetical protein
VPRQPPPAGWLDVAIDLLRAGLHTPVLAYAAISALASAGGGGEAALLRVLELAGRRPPRRKTCENLPDLRIR